VVKAIGNLGDRLLSRFVPRAEARASCCGNCCATGTTCQGGKVVTVYSCYGLSQAGCRLESNYYVPTGARC
jgi:hypothetical protein